MTGRGAIPDIFITSIALYYIFTIFQNNNYEDLKHSFSIFFLLFCLYGILRSIFSEFPIYSLTEEGAVFYFRYLFFLLGSIYLYKINPKILKYFFYISLFCIGFLLFDSFIQFVFKKNIFFLEAYSLQRITSVMGDEAILGRYVAPISAISIVLFLQYFKKNTFLISVLIFFSLLIILISGDRAPLLRYLMFIVGLIFILPKNKIKYLSYLFVASAISLFFIINSPQLKFRIIDDTLDQITQTTPKFMPYSKHYEEHFHSAYKMGMDNILFGQGPNIFEKVCGYPQFEVTFRSCTQHPHNFYWQLFSENGVIGLFFLITLYFIILYRFLILIYENVIKKKSNEDYFFKASTGLMMLCFIFPIIPNMSFYNNWNNIFLFIMLSLWLYAWSFYDKKKY